MRLTAVQYAEIQGRRAAQLAPKTNAGQVRKTPNVGASPACVAEGSIPSPAPNKHGAVPTHRETLRFDSKHEAKQWDMLEYRLAFGEITHLQRQVTFTFTVKGVSIGRYKADFMYRTPDGIWHVADAKSKHTRTLPGWHRTKQLMRACYHIEVEELL